MLSLVNLAYPCTVLYQLSVDLNVAFRPSVAVATYTPISEWKILANQTVIQVTGVITLSR